MAAPTSRPFGYLFDTAGDITEDHIIVRKLYLVTGATAGTYTFKDAYGNVIISLYGAANSTQEYDYPFGENFTPGLELDALPSGGVAEVIVS